MKISYYSDPGHGWGAVERSVLEDLGILDKITPYSYQRNNMVYLEEDCDLLLLIDTLKARGIHFDWSESYTNYDSPIRSYRPFYVDK